MRKKRYGKKRNRIETTLMVFRGDKKTTRSKVVFGMNFLFMAIGAGIVATVGRDVAREELDLKKAGAGVFGAGLTYLQASEVWRKSGPHYYWVPEKGSKFDRGAGK